MKFEEVLPLIKEGKKVCRLGWNNKGMLVKLIDNRNYKIHEDLAEGCFEMSFLAIKTANNGLVPWLASQTDILAEDWEVEENVCY